MIRLLLLGLLCSSLYAELDLTLPPIPDKEVIELEKKIAELKLKLNLGEKRDYKKRSL